MFHVHCKDLHPKYISTTTLEMYSTSISGAQLPDVAHYIYSTFPLQLSVVIFTTIQLKFGLQPNIHDNYISWLQIENTYISTTTEKMQSKIMCISTTTEKLPTSLLQLERCSLRIYTSLPRLKRCTFTMQKSLLEMVKYFSQCTAQLLICK